MTKNQPEALKAHCPTCDGERVCKLHGTTDTKWDWDDRQGHSMWGGAEHSLLQCRGCETVFYHRASWNSEDMDQWYGPDGETMGEYARSISTYPKPESKTKPGWISAIERVDAQLGEILDETYLAYDNRSYILTTIGSRTAIDRATDVLKIDAGKSFEEKLGDLQSSGWIGQTEREVLDVVINAGSAAAHRGWRPSASQIAHLLTAMEVFLQKAIIVEKKALSLKASIPEKPKRAKKPKGNPPKSGKKA